MQSLTIHNSDQQMSYFTFSPSEDQGIMTNGDIQHERLSIIQDRPLNYRSEAFARNLCVSVEGQKKS